MRKLRYPRFVSKTLFVTTIVANMVISPSFADVSITYQYDALGRLVTVIDDVNGNRTYKYDAAGNRSEAIAESTDPFDNVTLQCSVAYNGYGNGHCVGTDSSSSATVVFRVGPLPLATSEYSLSWQTSGCSSTHATSTCSKTISNNQTVALNAILTHIPSGSTKSINADAIYHYVREGRNR